jgi:hypothetical protein
MTEFQERDRDNAPMGIIPSGYGSREEMQSGFRSIRKLLWGVLGGVAVTLGAVVVLSGDRELIVALSSDGHMQTLFPLSDPVYEKNFQKIVRFFVTEFLENLTAYDSFEISFRLEKALSVMAPDLRRQMKREILSQSLVDAVGRARIHTTLSVRTLSLHRVASGVWTVGVDGARTTYPYGTGTARSQDFSARLLLRKGAPTVFNPYGLWVTRYQEKAQNHKPEGP